MKCIFYIFSSQFLHAYPSNAAKLVGNGIFSVIQLAVATIGILASYLNFWASCTTSEGAAKDEKVKASLTKLPEHGSEGDPVNPNGEGSPEAIDPDPRVVGVVSPTILFR